MFYSTVCVYCGSSNNVAEKYKVSAKAIGQELARRGAMLVFGGGHVGLMGIVADAVMTSGGKAVGIIPEHILSREVQHTGLTELHIVPDMHTRKRMMADRAEAFVVLPGGFGTLDEAFEILTWRKLGIHDKPIIIFNQDGFWDDMIALIESTISEGFSQPPDRDLYKVVTDVKGLFAALDEARTPGISAMAAE